MYLCWCSGSCIPWWCSGSCRCQGRGGIEDIGDRSKQLSGSNQSRIDRVDRCPSSFDCSSDAGLTETRLTATGASV